MPARAYWQGQIRLALVSIPVEVYAATKSGATIAFHQIHEPSGKRINYEKIVQGIGPVDRGEIVKGYEVSKGNYVLLDDDEIEAAKVESRRTLVQLSGRPVRSFAYPFGAVDHRTAAAARANGFELAVTCEERSLRRRENPLRLPRISAFEEPLERFIARVERALGVAAGALASRG